MEQVCRASSKTGLTDAQFYNQRLLEPPHGMVNDAPDTRV